MQRAASPVFALRNPTPVCQELPGHTASYVNDLSHSDSDRCPDYGRIHFTLPSPLCSGTFTAGTLCVSRCRYAFNVALELRSEHNAALPASKKLPKQSYPPKY